MPYSRKGAWVLILLAIHKVVDNLVPSYYYIQFILLHFAVVAGVVSCLFFYSSVEFRFSISGTKCQSKTNSNSGLCTITYGLHNASVA